MARILLSGITLAVLLGTSSFLSAQNTPIPVADQTFRMEGEHEYVYAFAQGDQVALHIQLLVGRQVRTVEFVEPGGPVLFSTYALDSTLDQTIRIPQTGVYALRIRESGMGKKVCRFTLHRSPESPMTARLDTRVPWDIRQHPQWQERRRFVPAGKKTEMLTLGGQVTVTASKMGIKKPVGAYSFTLPPRTVSWAYRIAVGQSLSEARKKDADQLSSALNSGAAKLLPIHPETALAAFALGMAVDLTVPKAGEDVEYALLTPANLAKFNKQEPYEAFIWQGDVSSDVQRRYSPLDGNLCFAFRSDNWMDDITVTVDIEVVTETPIFAEEIYLEKL
ncbi:MAG: hypothetical protein IT260_22265 [Saprospiraceae bacterium]|nr:hypothetical protein [Saprospiraceae bacterium]